MIGSDREERLWEVARYLEVLLRCDVSSLQFDRVSAILDEDYALTIADFVDVVARADVPEPHRENVPALRELGVLCFDHTLDPVDAGDLIAEFFQLIDAVTVRPEASTALRVVQALVTRDVDSALGALADRCSAVRTAACLNSHTAGKRWELCGGDYFNAVYWALDLVPAEAPENAEGLWGHDVLAGTQCECIEPRGELSNFFAQLGLMEPWPPGMPAEVRSIGALAWTTLDGIETLGELVSVAGRSPEDPAADGISVTFRRSPDGFDRLDVLHAYGPLAGRLELAMPNYRGMAERADPGEDPPLAASFMIGELVKEVWNEVADVLQGAWEHIPAEDVLGDHPRPRSIAWACAIQVLPDGSVDTRHNQVSFRSPSGELAAVEADTVQGAWAALRDLVPGWRR